MRARDGPFIIFIRCGPDTREHLPIDRRNLFDDRAAAAPFAGEDAGIFLSESEFIENRMHVSGASWKLALLSSHLLALPAQQFHRFVDNFR